MKKRNIRDFGKTYDYLKDPDLRTKATGDTLLTIENAEFSGASFQDLDWKNIRFVNCDFLGGYEIQLAFMTKCQFENCRFAGIFGFGEMHDVRFLHCEATGEQYVGGDYNCTGVVFEECRFIGTTDDKNHWGGVGTYGEASFVKCTIKRFMLAAYTKLTLTECETDGVALVADSPNDHSPNSGYVFKHLTLVIDRCKLSGEFRTSPSHLASLTLRDTQFEFLNLANTTIKGDVLMERVGGGYVDGPGKGNAGNLTIRDSHFGGAYETGFYVGAFKKVLIENCRFIATASPSANFSGGYNPDTPGHQPMLTQSMILRNVRSPFIRAGRLAAGLLRIENCNFDTAELQQSRIAKLEILGTTINRRLDLSRTQVKEQNITLPPTSKLSGRVDDLEGSNVRIPQ